MKKIFLIIAIIAVVFSISGCSDIFTDGQDGSAPESVIPKGYGAVRLSFVQGAIRTVMPELDVDKLLFDYSFWLTTDDGPEQQEPDQLEKNKFLLKPGYYVLFVTAYLEDDTEHGFPVASGGEEFEVTENLVTPVPITLSPNVNDEGAGTLELMITGEIYSDAVVTVEFTNLFTKEIYPLEDIQIDEERTFTNVPYGYYLLRVELYSASKSVKAVKAQVVHIYSNLPTAATFTFVKREFISYNIVLGESLTVKLNWLLSREESDKNYIVEVDTDDETIAPYIFFNDDRENITITLKGVGYNRSVHFSGTGSMFTVASVRLILENITFHGNGANNAPLITVNAGGTLDMRTGSVITGNINTGFTANSGGGVWVNSGTFTLNGGTITKNNAGGNIVHGGGVHVTGSYNAPGTFTMFSGDITGNISSNFGGGVHVGGYGNFTMIGGTIGGEENVSSNTAAKGGGVYIADTGTLTLGGGAVIKKNYITGFSDNDEYRSNVYLPDGKHIILDSVNTPTSSMEIWVQTESLDGVIIASGAIADYEDYFKADKNENVVCYDGSLILVEGTKGLAFAPISNGDAFSVANGIADSSNVIIPNTFFGKPVRAIVAEAFKEKTYIISVTIPDNVQTINSSAFFGCTDLTTVTFGGNNTNFVSDDVFPGDLEKKYRLENGKAGKYERSYDSSIWIKEGTGIQGSEIIKWPSDSDGISLVTTGGNPSSTAGIDLEVSSIGTVTVMFTSDKVYEDLKWTLNGIEIPDDETSDNAYTFYSKGKPANTKYTIGLRLRIVGEDGTGGEFYSTDIIVFISED